jgi:hypothetical protein
MFNKIKQVKFYADTPIQINKRFSWRVKNKHGALQAIKRFQLKGWKIRAAWYENERIV